MNCLKCRSKIQSLDIIYGILECSNCSSNYLVVESVPIMVNEETDFYRYNRKFKRLINLKNEQKKK